MTKCKISYCGRKIPKESKWPKTHKSGYCTEHYAQSIAGTLRNYSLHHSECKISGCTTPVLTAHYCSKHYHQIRRGKTIEYAAWYSLIERCTNKNKGYHNYGGRSITVCKEWLDSFEQFFRDMGERPKGLSINRIENDKGYYKENCRWATRKEQANNKRNNVNVRTKITSPDN